MPPYSSLNDEKLLVDSPPCLYSPQCAGWCLVCTPCTMCEDSQVQRKTRYLNTFFRKGINFFGHAAGRSG